MGGKGGGSTGSNLGTQTQQGSNQTHTDQTSVYQPAAFGTFQNLVNAADMLTSQPFSPYGPDQFNQNWDMWPYLVAPRNVYEDQMMANAGNLYQYAAPYIDQAGQMTNDTYNQLGDFGWGTLGNASNVIQGGLPYVGAGSQYMQAGAREVPRLSSGDIAEYMSPYQQWVINSTMGNIAENQSRQQQDVLGNAASRGALGGDRLGVAQSELARQQGLAANQTLSGLWNQNYQQALGTAQGQQQVQQGNLGRQLQAGQGLGQLGATQGQLGQGLGGLAGVGSQLASTQGNLASQMGNLGLANQQAFSQQLNALSAAGSQERAFEQQRLNAIYEQYLREQGFPFQALQYRAGIQMPAAGGMGGQQLGIGDQLSNMYQLSQSMTPSGQGGGGGMNPMSMIGSMMGKGLQAGGRVPFAEGGVVNPFDFAEGGMVIPGVGMQKAKSIFPDIPLSNPKIHWPEPVKFMEEPKMPGGGGKGGGGGGKGKSGGMPKMPKMPKGGSEEKAGKELAKAAVEKEHDDPGTQKLGGNPNGQPDPLTQTQEATPPAGLSGAESSVTQEGGDVQGNAGNDNLSSNPFDTYAMGSDDYFGAADGASPFDEAGFGNTDLGGGGFDEAGFNDFGNTGDVGFGNTDEMMGGGGEGGKGFSGGGKGFGGRIGYDEGGEVDEEEDLGGNGEEEDDEGENRDVQLPEIVVKPDVSSDNLEQGMGRGQPTQQESPFNISSQDRDIMARTMWGESRGEPPEGQQAVANVILNRARMAGTSPAFESQKKGQFEPWMHPSIASRMRGLTSEQLAPFHQVIDKALQDDITKGATHFYSPGAQRGLGRAPPRWDDGSGRMFGTQRFFNHPYGGQQPTALAGNNAPAMQRVIDEGNQSRPVSAFTPEPGGFPERMEGRRGVGRLTLPDEVGKSAGLADRPAPMGPPRPSVPSTPSGGRSAVPIGRSANPFQGAAGASPMGMMRSHGPEGNEMMPVFPGHNMGASRSPFAPPQNQQSRKPGIEDLWYTDKGITTGPPDSRFTDSRPLGAPGPMPPMPPMGGGQSPFAGLGSMLRPGSNFWRGMGASQSPYPGISIMEGLGAHSRNMPPDQIGERMAQNALPPPDKSGNRLFELPDGNVAKVGPNGTHRLTGKFDENGQPVLQEVQRGRQSSTTDQVLSDIQREARDKGENISMAEAYRRFKELGRKDVGQDRDTIKFRRQMALQEWKTEQGDHRKLDSEKRSREDIFKSHGLDPSGNALTSAPQKAMTPEPAPPTAPTAPPAAPKVESKPQAEPSPEDVKDLTAKFNAAKAAGYKKDAIVNHFKTKIAKERGWDPSWIDRNYPKD